MVSAQFHNNSHNVNNALDKNNKMSHLKIKADRFREILATKCCSCFSTVPSFALIILAVLLAMLLIATIPLAFAFTYMLPQAKHETVRLSRIIVNRNQFNFPDKNKIIVRPPFKQISFLPINISSCKGFGFACTNDPNQVVGTNKRCDGTLDCSDGSDEMDCKDCNTPLTCLKNKRRVCLKTEDLCDGIFNCDDNFDETKFCKKICDKNELNCTSSNFKKRTQICVPIEFQCDGLRHCSNGEDEKNCKFCRNEGKYCEKLSMCVPKQKLCDGNWDCPDGDDETDCDCTECSGTGKVLCNGNKKMCLARAKVCDGIKDCPYGEDEIDCLGRCSINNKNNLQHLIIEKNESLINYVKHIKCETQFYDWRYGCDGTVEECNGYCENCFLQLAFDCYSKKKPENNSLINKCISRNAVCDGKFDCHDGSDELNCGCSHASQFLCNAKTKSDARCINFNQKCDGFYDCPDGDDEEDCSNCVNGAFFCASDKKCIDSRKRCDGINDCSDEADERSCSCEECESHPFKMYICSKGNKCYRESEVCEPTSKCPDADEKDELYCAVKISQSEMLF